MQAVHAVERAQVVLEQTVPVVEQAQGLERAVLDSHQEGIDGSRHWPEIIGHEPHILKPEGPEQVQEILAHVAEEQGSGIAPEENRNVS